MVVGVAVTGGVGVEVVESFERIGTEGVEQPVTVVADDRDH
jgi:hypothetical protein